MLFAGATLSTPVANLLGGVITARALSPTELGVLNTAALFPSYLVFLHFGVFSGLARNLPLEIGAGRRIIGERLTETSAAIATWVGLVAALVCGTVAITQISKGSNLFFWSMAATSLSAFAAMISNHADTTLRGRQQFRSLSIVMLISNVTVAISASLPLRFGGLGAVWRIALCAGVVVVARVICNAWRPKFSIDWRLALDLARVGLPLLISGTFFSLLMVADRSVIALLMTPTDVGNFALAGMTVTSLQFVPQSISMVLFPKIAQHWGAHSSPTALRRFVVLNLGFNLATMIPLSLACYWGMEPLVRRFFPAYIAGIPAAKIACLSSMLWVYLGVGSVIGVINKMGPYLIAMAASLLIIWCLGIYLVKSGYGIEGAAWARFFGTSILCSFTIYYAWRLTSAGSE